MGDNAEFDDAGPLPDDGPVIGAHTRDHDPFSQFYAASAGISVEPQTGAARARPKGRWFHRRTRTDTTAQRS